MSEHKIPNPEAMCAYGSSLCGQATKFLLSGELGSGKTTIAKGIAAGLGIDPNQVQSPTYTYVHIYDDKLLHIDMWRIESAEKLHELGILELIDKYDHIIIERPKWPELYATAERCCVYIQKSDIGRVIQQIPRQHA